MVPSEDSVILYPSVPQESACGQLDLAEISFLPDHSMSRSRATGSAHTRTRRQFGSLGIRYIPLLCAPETRTLVAKSHKLTPHPAAEVALSTSWVLLWGITGHPDLQTNSLSLTKHHSCLRRGWKQKLQKKPAGSCLLLHHHANGHREILEALTDTVGPVFFSFSPDR